MTHLLERRTRPADDTAHEPRERHSREHRRRSRPCHAGSAEALNALADGPRPDRGLRRLASRQRGHHRRGRRRRRPRLLRRRRHPRLLHGLASTATRAERHGFPRACPAGPGGAAAGSRWSAIPRQHHHGRRHVGFRGARLVRMVAEPRGSRCPRPHRLPARRGELHGCAPKRPGDLAAAPRPRLQRRSTPRTPRSLLSWPTALVPYEAAAPRCRRSRSAPIPAAPAGRRALRRTQRPTAPSPPMGRACPRRRRSSAGPRSPKVDFQRVPRAPARMPRRARARRRPVEPPASASAAAAADEPQSCATSASPCPAHHPRARGACRRLPRTPSTGVPPSFIVHRAAPTSPRGSAPRSSTTSPSRDPGGLAGVERLAAASSPRRSTNRLASRTAA